MSVPVAILAGGMGTRLRHLTEKIPKSLLDINGEPFVSHQLSLLRSKGIIRVVICAGYLGEMIRGVVGDGSRFDIQVEYSFDGGRLLGTGGAIKKALPLLGKAFFVLYGDSYLECNYAEIESAFFDSGKSGLMTVLQNNGEWDTSNVVFQEGRIVRYDKRQPTYNMKHIDYGLGVFHSRAFDNYSDDEVVDLATVYQGLLARNELAGFEVKYRFYEIGSRRGLRETESYLKGMSDNNGQNSR